MAAVTHFNLNGADAFCQQFIYTDYFSTIFKRVVLLSSIAGYGWQGVPFGRPGNPVVIGGDTAKWSLGQKLSLTGARNLNFNIQGTTASGTKYMTPSDNTNPTSSQSAESGIGALTFFWSDVKTPFYVDATTVKRANGKYEVLNPFRTGTKTGLESHLDTIGTDIWTGIPSTQNPSQGFYDQTLGILAAFQYDKDNNVIANTIYGSGTAYYGNVALGTVGSTLNSDAAQATGIIHTNAANVSLDLIDQANITDGVRTYGTGVDLVLTDGPNYLKLKQEALAKGGTIIHNGMVPGEGTYGYEDEAIKYGKVMITYDPKCPTNGLLAIQKDCLMFVAQPKFNLTVDKFTENTLPGQPNTFYSYVESVYSLCVTRPRLGVYWNNVS